LRKTAAAAAAGSIEENMSRDTVEAVVVKGGEGGGGYTSCSAATAYACDLSVARKLVWFKPTKLFSSEETISEAS